MTSDEENAFAFDDDIDIDTLINMAAEAGDRGTSGDNDEDANILFGLGSAKNKEPVRESVPEPEPEESPLDLSEFEEPFEEESDPLDDVLAAGTNVEAEIAKIQRETAESLAAQPEPVEKTFEPAPEPTHEREPVQDFSNARPSDNIRAYEKGSARIVRQTEEEQIAHAQAILGAADEYRGMNSQTRDVVAQLISQGAEYSDDPATIAIRAINADELTFKTMEALKDAKALDPVDRAFYILELEDSVRKSLGQLCVAFSDVEISAKEMFGFSKALVGIIEDLDNDVIGFVSATESILRVAKGR